MAKQKTLVEVVLGRGTAWWSALSPQQKRALVFTRLEKGESNPGIAADLGITPNSIASLRDKWNKGDKKNPFTLKLLPAAEAAPAPKPPPAIKETPLLKKPPRSKTLAKLKHAPVTKPTATPAQEPEQAAAEEVQAVVVSRTYGEPSREKPRFSASEWDSCDHMNDTIHPCGFVGSIKKKTGKFCPKHAHLHQ